MKGKSTFSFIAVLVLVAAIIMLITRFDFNHMDGDEWTILLIIAGVLLGVIALIFRGPSKPKEDDVEEPSDELKLKHTEFKLQELRKNGILSETEYQQKLSDARLKSGGYKKTVENLKALLDAGLLTEEEFERKSNEAYEKSKAEPSTRSKEDSNDRAEMAVKLMELREADLITQEEFEEQMAKI